MADIEFIDNSKIINQKIEAAIQRALKRIGMQGGFFIPILRW